MNHEQLIQHLEARLGELDARIAALEARYPGLEPSRQEAYRREMTQIRQQRERAAARLEELRVARAESWLDEDIRDGVLRIFDDIGRRLDKTIFR